MSEMIVVLHVSPEFAWQVTADEGRVEIERIDKRAAPGAVADGARDDGAPGGAGAGGETADA